MTRARLLPWVFGAHACTLLALLVFAAMTGLPARAPLALPGAGGMPLAWLFNLLAWTGPGLIVAGVAARLRDGLGAGERGVCGSGGLAVPGDGGAPSPRPHSPADRPAAAAAPTTRAAAPPGA